MKEDIKKMYKELYDVNSGKLEIVNVPEFTYLKLKGYGNPRKIDFKAQSILIKLVCKEIKKYYKDHNEEDKFVSAPIEAVWKTYGEQNIDIARQVDIKYNMQVIIPEDFTEEKLKEVMEPLAKTIKNKARRETTRNDDNEEKVYSTMVTYLDQLYIKKSTEGHCIQALHVGPYDQEIQTTSKLMEFITISNLGLRGLHHEIYLNDFTKVTPDRLKTIVRYPIA